MADGAQQLPAVERVDFETEDLIGFRWWTADAIITGNDSFYPRSLPTLLPAFLAGENIDEPFQYWPSVTSCMATRHPRAGDELQKRLVIPAKAGTQASAPLLHPLPL